MNAVEKLIEAARAHPLYANIKKTNGKIVIGRGEKINPEYLFIGEAPGQDENKVGKPFVGKSGKILDRWIKEAGIVSFTIINAVPIIPLDEAGQIRTPTHDEIEYFRPYTRDLIRHIKPKRIVCLGKSAAKFLQEDANFKNTGWNGRIGFIYHPSYFLRNGKNGVSDFLELIKSSPQPKKQEAKTEINEEYYDEVEFTGMSDEDAVKKFISMLGGNVL